MGLLEDIAPVIAQSVDIVMTDLAVRRHEGGTFDPVSGRQLAGLDIDYACRGRIVDYTNFERLNTRIEDMDRKVIVVQRTLSIKPEVGQRIVDGVREYLIRRVDEDPAHVTWIMQAQG